MLRRQPRRYVKDGDHSRENSMKDRISHATMLRLRKRRSNVSKRRKQAAALAAVNSSESRREGGSSQELSSWTATNVFPGDLTGAASVMKSSALGTASTVVVDLRHNTQSMQMTSSKTTTADSVGSKSSNTICSNFETARHGEQPAPVARMSQSLGTDSHVKLDTASMSEVETYFQSLKTATNYSQLLRPLRNIRAALAAINDDDDQLVKVVIGHGIVPISLRIFTNGEPVKPQSLSKESYTSHLQQLFMLLREIVWILSLIAAGSLEYAQLLLPNMLPQTVKLLSNMADAEQRKGSYDHRLPFDAQLAEHCCGLIGNMAAEETIRPKLITGAHIVTSVKYALVMGRKLCDTPLMSTAAWCLSNIAQGRATSARVFVQAQILQELLPFLSPTWTSIQEGRPQTSSTLNMNAKSIGGLTNPIGMSSNPHYQLKEGVTKVQQEALWVIVYLTTKEPAYVATFVQAGLLAAVIRLFCAPSTSAPAVLLLSLRTISNLIAEPILVSGKTLPVFQMTVETKGIWQRLNLLLLGQLQSSLAGPPAETEDHVAELVEEMLFETAHFISLLAHQGTHHHGVRHAFSQSGCLQLICRLFAEHHCCYRVERGLAMALSCFLRSKDPEFVKAIVDGWDATGDVINRFLMLLNGRAADPELLSASLAAVANVLECLPRARRKVEEADGISILEQLRVSEELPSEIRLLAGQICERYFADSDDEREENCDDDESEGDIVVFGGAAEAQTPVQPKAELRSSTTSHPQGRRRLGVLPAWLRS